MKLLLILVALFAFCQAGPARKFKFTKGNAGTSGRAAGDETSVDTESNVKAGEDTGLIARTHGAGVSRGQGESTLDLESWAGFEGHQTGGAGGGGRALGDETNIETNSDVFIGEETGFAKSASQGGARGLGESAIDLEAFGSLDGWSSGLARGVGKATGEESEIDSESFVESEFGRGTLSKSESSGAALNNNGLAIVDLENFAIVDETNSEAKSSVKGIGNKVSGSSGSSTLHGADGEIQIGSEAEGTAEASGRGGVRTIAETNDNGFFIKAGSEGRGEGDIVITGGNSKTGLTNTKSAGESQSFARSSAKGSSFAESGTSLVIGERKPATPDQDCDTDC